MAANQQSKLIIYLIMMLGLVLGYLYSTSSDPVAAVPTLDGKFQLTALQALKGAKIDKAIISSEAFTSLRVFGSLPVEPVTGGKTNPFQ